MTIVLSAPWHLLQYQHYGFAFVNDYFMVNVVRRGTRGVDPWHLRGPLFYWTNISLSSLGFAAFLPALVGSAVLIRRGVWRRELTFVAGAAGVIVVLLSLPASKLAHYAYPAYPFIAVTIAACAWYLLQGLAARYPGLTAGLGARACLAVVILVLGARWAKLALVVVPSARWEYAPMVVYQQTRPQMERGECQLVFYRFQKPAAYPDYPRGFTDTDVCYLSKMPLARWVDDPKRLADVVGTGRPTLLFALSGDQAEAVLPRHLKVERLSLPEEKRFHLYAVQAGTVAVPLDRLGLSALRP